MPAIRCFPLALAPGDKLHLRLRDMPLPARGLPTHSAERERAMWSAEPWTVAKVGRSWATLSDGRPDHGRPTKVLIDGSQRNVDRWKGEYAPYEVCRPEDLDGMVWAETHRHALAAALREASPRALALAALAIGYAHRPPAGLVPFRVLSRDELAALQGGGPEPFGGGGAPLGECLASPALPGADRPPDPADVNPALL